MAAVQDSQQGGGGDAPRLRHHRLLRRQEPRAHPGNDLQVSQSVSQRLNDSVAGPTTVTAFISTQRPGSTSGPEIFFWPFLRNIIIKISQIRGA